MATDQGNVVRPIDFIESQRSYSTEKRLNNLRHQRDSEIQARKELQDELNDAADRLADLEDEFEKSQEKLAAADSQNSEFMSYIAQIESELEEKDDSIQSLKAQIESIKMMFIKQKNERINYRNTKISCYKRKYIVHRRVNIGFLLSIGFFCLWLFADYLLIIRWR